MCVEVQGSRFRGLIIEIERFEDTEAWQLTRVYRLTRKLLFSIDYGLNKETFEP